MSIQLNFLTSLPEDPLFEIFSYLDTQSLARCCQVNQKWSELVSRDILWKIRYPKIAVPTGMTLKQYLNKVAIASENGVLERIKNFFEKISFNQVGKFICLCAFDDYHVEINFSCREPEMQKPVVLQETVIFMKTFSAAGDTWTANSSFPSKKKTPSIFSGCFKIQSHVYAYSERRYQICLPRALRSKQGKELGNYIRYLLEKRTKKLERQALYYFITNFFHHS